MTIVTASPIVEREPIKSREPARVSPLPARRLNPLQMDGILDLLACVIAGGKRANGRPDSCGRVVRLVKALVASQSQVSLHRAEFINCELQIGP